MIQQLNDNETDFEEDDYNGFVQSNNDEPLQVDYIKNSINWPLTDSVPINEFEFNAICSLMFPKLFPNSKGDPTKKDRLKKFQKH